LEFARKAISKLKRDDFELVMQKFIQNADTFELKRDDVQTLVGHIRDSAEYLFNKGHAAAYGCLAYLTMYLKQNYYLDYVRHYINASDNNIHIMKIIAEAKQKGYLVHLPKLTYIYDTDDKCIVKDGQLFLTDKCIKFRNKTNPTGVLNEYVEKMSNPKKMYEFYPFRIYDVIKKYRQKYIYLPLTSDDIVYVTLAYVVQFNAQNRECYVTDGITVKKLFVTDERLFEVIRNAEKTKNVLMLKIHEKTIMRARVYDA